MLTRADKFSYVLTLFILIMQYQLPSQLISVNTYENLTALVSTVDANETISELLLRYKTWDFLSLWENDRASQESG